MIHNNINYNLSIHNNYEINKRYKLPCDWHTVDFQNMY